MVCCGWRIWRLINSICTCEYWGRSRSIGCEMGWKLLNRDRVAGEAMLYLLEHVTFNRKKIPHVGTQKVDNYTTTISLTS